jgi:hypothetical protein
MRSEKENNLPKAIRLILFRIHMLFPDAIPVMRPLSATPSPDEWSVRRAVTEAQSIN